jgi:hypothetical protein
MTRRRIIAALARARKSWNPGMARISASAAS